MSIPAEAIKINIKIMFSKFLKYSKMLIFEKAFEIRLTVEKQIKKIKEIVPSLKRMIIQK